MDGRRCEGARQSDTGSIEADTTRTEASKWLLDVYIGLIRGV